MIKSRCLRYFVAICLFVLCSAFSSQSQTLWDMAKQNRGHLKISTLFTAQNVRDYLASEQGINNAIDWCKKTGVTHVFIESYRDGYTADRKTLENARDRFKKEGFEVSGCITTTGIGKTSTGWRGISCYTDLPTQENLQKVFEYAAAIFDEIMIDDFLFTDCQCQECVKARGDKSWADYRCELMNRMARDRILGPAKKVNPNVRIIIKYPQWYDDFHNRGYDVIQQTADYDRIWVGTETRDYDNARWGRKVQYEAYYIMRWLGEIGGDKTGGGWFDPYGTTENTYVEQARQTVLADAREMLLFCYGSLLRDTGPANVEKLRAEIPGLFELAKLVRNKPIKGILAPKPPNSDAGGEQYVFDFVGMLGLPLTPTAKVDADAKAAFFPVHALKDSEFTGKLKKMLYEKKPVLITDGLANRLTGVDLQGENLTILQVKGNPHNLLKLTREELKPIRDKLLAPFGIEFDAPNKVALYLIGDPAPIEPISGIPTTRKAGSFAGGQLVRGLVVENFNSESIDAVLEFSGPIKVQKALVLPPGANVEFSCSGSKLEFSKIAPRTLVAVQY